MKRFWQFIPVPPRSWLVKFGFYLVLLTLLFLFGSYQLPPSVSRVDQNPLTLCGQPNKWLALVDRYLGTSLAQAQTGNCVTLSAQCQGPYNAYPGFALDWDPLGYAPSYWRAEIVKPRQEFARPDGRVQAGSQGFAQWSLVDPLFTLNPASPRLLNSQLKASFPNQPVDTYATPAQPSPIDDDTYYQTAVNFNDVTQCACPAGVDCGTDLNNPNKPTAFPNCPAYRTRDFTDTRPGYGMAVSSAACPWQRDVTTDPLSIPCGRTALYTSALSSDRVDATGNIGTTDWNIQGLELCGGSFPCQAGEPTLTANQSQPPLLYEGDFSDGSHVQISMDGNQVVALRTSAAGGVCNPRPPQLSCTLLVNNLTNATWQSNPNGSQPVLSWSTSPEFRSGEDTIKAQMYDLDRSPNTSIAQSASTAGSGSTTVNASSLRVRPGESDRHFRFIATAEDTGPANGPDPYQPGTCVANFTITPETPPPPPDISCRLSACNGITCSWPAVPNAKLYLGETYRNGVFAALGSVPASTTEITFSPLDQNVTYSIRAKTIDRLENASAWSPLVSVATQSCPAAPPPGSLPPPGSPPVQPSLTASAGATCNQVDLSWGPAVNNATSYKVYRDNLPAPIATLGAEARSYPDTGLAGSTPYTYKVEAANANGSVWSNQVSVRTADCSVGPPPPGAGDFQISAVPASRTINPGQSTSYTVTVTATNLPNTAVNLSVTGQPSGASPSFVQTPVTTPPADGSVSTTLNVSTLATTPLGTHTLTITGVGAGITRSTTVNLVLVQPNGAPCVGRCDGSSPPGPPTDGLMCSTPPLLSFAFIYDDPDGNSASQFSFQVASDAGFSNLIVDRQNVASIAAAGDTITQLVEVRRGGGAGILDYNTSYFWRAQVWDSRGAASGWSSGIAFTTPNHAYPQVDFTTDRSNLNVTGPTTVKFTDQTAVAPGARIVRWFWNFVSGVATAPNDQDGAPDKVLQTRPPTTRSEPTVVYSSSGAKTVTLTAQDDGGAAFSCSLTKVLFGGTGANLQWREIKAR